jgi:hypothetical protein
VSVGQVVRMQTVSLFLLCPVEVQRPITAGRELQAVLPGLQEKVT